MTYPEKDIVFAPLKLSPEVVDARREQREPGEDYRHRVLDIVRSQSDWSSPSIRGYGLNVKDFVKRKPGRLRHEHHT